MWYLVSSSLLIRAKECSVIHNCILALSESLSVVLNRRPATFAQAAKLRRSAATKEKELAQCEYAFILALH